MKTEVAEAITELNAYVPNDYDNYQFFYEFLDSVEALGYPVEVVDPIFLYIEKYPDADMGAPGPLVHLLERYRPHYEMSLIESLGRRPTRTSVLMVNRILNSDIDAGKYRIWLTRLRAAMTHPLADEIVLADCERYHAKHMGTDNPESSKRPA